MVGKSFSFSFSFACRLRHSVTALGSDSTTGCLSVVLAPDNENYEAYFLKHVARFSHLAFVCLPMKIKRPFFSRYAFLVFEIRWISSAEVTRVFDEVLELLESCAFFSV